jgi:hypothetical protein
MSLKNDLISISQEFAHYTGELQEKLTELDDAQVVRCPFLHLFGTKTYKCKYISQRKSLCNISINPQSVDAWCSRNISFSQKVILAVTKFKYEKT